MTFTLDKTILSPRESLSGQNLGLRTGVESNKNAIPEFQTSGMAIFKGRAVFPTLEKLPAMCKGVFLHQLFQFIKVGTHVLVADVIVVQTAAEVLVIGSHVD